MKNKNSSKNKSLNVMIIAFVLALVCLVIGITFAVYTYSSNGNIINELSTGTVNMTYTERQNKISITNAMPLEDSVGRTLSDTSQVFDFALDVTINGRMSIAYQITAKKDARSTLQNNEVKLYLERSTDGTSYSSVMEPSNYSPIAENNDFGALAGEMILDTGTVTSTTHYDYRLRMWVDKNYEVTGNAKSFTVTVNAYGKDANKNN